MSQRRGPGLNDKLKQISDSRNSLEVIPKLFRSPKAPKRAYSSINHRNSLLKDLVELQKMKSYRQTSSNIFNFQPKQLANQIQESQIVASLRQRHTQEMKQKALFKAQSNTNRPRGPIQQSLAQGKPSNDGQAKKRKIKVVTNPSFLKIRKATISDQNTP